MAVSELSSIGSIATFVNENIDTSNGISGNMVEIVDQARQHVANFTGDTIGSNAITAKYQGAIIDFATADAIDLEDAGGGGDKLRLGELRVEESGEAMSAKQYRMMGDMKLKAIGRKIQVSKSLS